MEEEKANVAVIGWPATSLSVEEICLRPARGFGSFQDGATGWVGRLNSTRRDSVGFLNGRRMLRRFLVLVIGLQLTFCNSRELSFV